MEYLCSTCKVMKDEEEFGLCSTYVTGRNPRCKECCNKAAKALTARKRHANTDLLERVTLLEKRIAALEPVLQLVRIEVA